jgi:Brp/Blh family beta-carotene 15,15'-monooxygenase
MRSPGASADGGYDSIPRHYSYVAVAGASLLGWVFPAAAGLLLGPLVLVGLLGLGLAHGACDQLVLPAVGQVRGHQPTYKWRFALGYLGLAAGAGLSWWQWPTLAVGFFFLLTVWHWGSADAPTQPGQRASWVMHSVVRGALLFAVPLRWWPAELQHHVNGLLIFAGASPLASVWFTHLAAWLWPLVVVGHLGLWSFYAYQGATKRWRTDVGEVGLLLGLFLTLPPLLALGVYFVFWHSLQHMLRLNRVLGNVTGVGQQRNWAGLGQEVAVFLQRALPSLGCSLFVPAGLYLVLPARLVGGHNLLGLAVVTAALLTLPHALVVSLALDAANWRVGGTHLPLATEGLPGQLGAPEPRP